MGGAEGRRCVPAPRPRVPLPETRRGAGLGRCRARLQSVWWDREAKPLVRPLTRHVAECAALRDEQEVRSCLPDVHRPPGRARAAHDGAPARPPAQFAASGVRWPGRGGAGGGWPPPEAGAWAASPSRPTCVLGPRWRGIDPARWASSSSPPGVQASLSPAARPTHPGCWPTRSSPRKRGKLCTP